MSHLTVCHVQAQMDLLPPSVICDTEMVIRIREADIPTFEFIDLPGISGSNYAQRCAYKPRHAGP